MTTPTITTDATGTAEALPTKATVDLEARGTATVPSVATATAEDCAETIRQALVDAGISDDHIRLVKVRLADPSNQFGSEGDDTFRATRRLQVDCAPATASKIAETAIDAGATTVDVRFALGEEKTQQLRSQAVATATERARSLAAHIAECEGVSIGPVRTVTTTTSEQGFQSLVDEALEFDPESDFQPSPIRISERVEAVFEISDE
ncbi:SIMPL domain-containing protein [Natronosalvus amylolyticus]|uniref:SIMPL domain-containing protein n=1 Tax=Natronosalvus amylolyticus TaxID=2961994 RepID=UPI0020C9871F|nr:SIMPL domain-containing protein [Natronosalvus amylolyticus]